MIGYSLVVGSIALATLIPVLLALYIVSNLRIVPTKYIAAAGVGLVFWFFFDTMGDAAQLDVNDGFAGGWSHLGLVVAFVAGITALAIFDHFTVRPAASISRQDLFWIPAGIAVVMGIHGLGEGWDFASVAHLTSQSVVDAFGGLSALASYPMHKALEASIIGATYAIFVGRNSSSARWHLPVLALLFAVPSIVGASIGYFVSFNTTYFYAFGVTAALYAALRLGEATISGESPSYLGPKMFVALLVGFLLLYTAALFH